MRFLVFFLVVFCVLTYVLFDSRALIFEQKTVGRYEMLEHVVATPVFYPDRLSRYFEKLVSKISK